MASWVTVGSERVNRLKCSQTREKRSYYLLVSSAGKMADHKMAVGGGDVEGEVEWVKGLKLDQVPVS